MKKLLVLLLAVMMITACIPAIAFADGTTDPVNPDIVQVKIGTSMENMQTMNSSNDGGYGSTQVYQLSAATKIDLSKSEYIYLQVVRSDVYKADTADKMEISYQIGSQYYEVERTAADSDVVKIPASQLRSQAYGDYDLVNITIGYNKMNVQKYVDGAFQWVTQEGTYYYKGYLKDIFVSSAGDYDKCDLENYIGYYTSGNHAISIYKDSTGEIKCKISDELDSNGKHQDTTVEATSIQDKDGRKQFVKLAVGYTTRAYLKIVDNQLISLDNYIYRKEAGETSGLTSTFSGKIANGEIFTKTSRDSAVINVTKNITYPSLKEAVADAKNGDQLQLQQDVFLDETVDVSADITLDLNGRTITAANGISKPFFFRDGGKLNVTDAGNTGKILVPVTPSTAQEALNYMVDYTTLQFASGSYDKLELRIRTIDKAEGDQKGAYKRSLKHITFEGTDGTEIKTFLVQPGHHYGDKKMVNYADNKDIEVDEANGYYSYIDIDDLIFDHLTFASNENLPGIDFQYWYNGDSPAYFGLIDNLSIINCKFNLTNKNDNAQAIKLADGGSHSFGKTTICNNTFEQAFQGMYLAGACGDRADVTIKGNLIKNTVHNAIALQGNVAGKAVIENNIIDGAKDRAFRLNTVASTADIKINNNVILNSGDDDGELIKDVSIAEGAKIDLEHNYWQLKEGISLAEAIAGNLSAPVETGVIAGTFAQDISQYMADGYQVAKNADGTYTVAKKTSSWTPSVPSKPDITTETAGNTTTVKTETTTIASGKESTAAVSDEVAKELVNQAVAKKADKVTIEVPKANAQVVKTELPSNAVLQLAEKTDASLNIVTGNAVVSFDHKALEVIAGAVKGEKITIVAEIVKEPTGKQLKLVGNSGLLAELKVVHESGTVSDFKTGNVTVALPIPNTLAAKTIKAIYLDEAGGYMTIPGEIVTLSGEKHYQFETNHFSGYALVEAEVIDENFDRIKSGIEGTAIKAKSSGGKGYIKLTWKKSPGYKVDYYQVYKSTKRFSGFGKDAYYTTADGKKTFYKNTKGLKKGTRYYYKVRGVRVIDGQKIYTKWSNKAFRTAK